MNERELRRRRTAFFKVIVRTWNYWPRRAVEEWTEAQFALVSRGNRNLFEVSDAALGAWARSGPAEWLEHEARALWGRGWAEGIEVDERR